MSLPIVVRAFVFDSEWRILLTQHKKNTPWVLPWGHVESWESLHDALVRELHEEFWITISFFEMDHDEILHHKWKKLHHFPLPISIYELHYQNSEWKDKSRIEYVFLTETTATITRTQTAEIAWYTWFEADDILMMKPNIETYDFIIEMLEKILGEDIDE